MAVVGPRNERESFEIEPGQVVFVPQGYFHYFENIGEDDLRLLVVFNDSTAESDNDIGISVSLGGVPRHALAATFGVPKSVFDEIPKLHQEQVIVARE